MRSFQIGPPTSKPKSYPDRASMRLRVSSASPRRAMPVGEALRLVGAEDAAVELVAAAVGGEVDDTAGGAAVLSLVAAGDDVDFFDEVLRQLGADEPVARSEVFRPSMM